MNIPHSVRWLAVVFGGSCLLESCAPTPEVVKLPMSKAGTGEKTLNGTLLAAVNDYRVSKGRSPLVRNAGLERLAQSHSEFMRRNRGKFSVNGTNVSHVGFEDRALQARLLLRMQNLGENLAAVPAKSMPEVVDYWIKSKDHEYNLRAGWSETGIGVVIDDDGTVFATQLFGTSPLSGVVSNDWRRSY